MNERENLPVAITAQNLAATTEKRESLVGRGLVALRNDALYRQAREIFDGKDGVKNWNVGRKKGNNREWNVAKNPAMYSAFKSFKQLANESFGKAYYPLAILYRDRNDIEDGHIHAGYYTRLAFDWCLANQANNDAELWCDLGNMHYPWTVDYGVTYSKEIAESFYRKAAEQGYARGQWELACMQDAGRYIEKNREPAEYWYRKAAEQDGSGFQYDLGEMYLNGHLVEKGFDQAVYWIRKAAEQGDVRGIEAMQRLIPIFELLKAAEQGNTDAKESLKKL